MQITITITDGKLTDVEQRLLHNIVATFAPPAEVSQIPLPPIVFEEAAKEPDPKKIFAQSTTPAPSPITAAALPPIPAFEEDEAVNADAPKLDVRGLPWDSRIHASSKALNADGTWRARRGLNNASLVARVEEELRQIVGAPAPAAVPKPPAQITEAAAAVGLPTVPAADTVVDFASLMHKATGLMASQKLTRDELEQCAQAVGLPTIVGALTRVDLVPTISAHIDAIVNAKG